MQWVPGHHWWQVLLSFVTILASVTTLILGRRFKPAETLKVNIFLGVATVFLLGFTIFYALIPSAFVVSAPRIAQVALTDTPLRHAAGTPPAISWPMAPAATHHHALTNSA